MLAVSSDECVRALMLAGFRVRTRAAGQTVLENGYRHVVVPDAMVMEHAAVATVLQAAGVAQSRFIELVSNAFPSERSPAYETGVRRARPARNTG